MENKEQLFNELKKLSKRANQRILRLERLTGIDEPFATKKLMDYLSTVNAISPTGRIRVSKKFTEGEMKAIIKATNMFLESKGSLVSTAKKEKTIAEKNVGKPISYKQLATVYSADQLYRWATDEFGSQFWKDFAPLVFRQNKYDWVNLCANYIDKVNDVTILNKLKQLYDYLRE